MHFTLYFQQVKIFVFLSLKTKNVWFFLYLGLFYKLINGNKALSLVVEFYTHFFKVIKHLEKNDLTSTNLIVN